MWTDKNRKRYERNGLRYPSDLTDDERSGSTISDGAMGRLSA
jgi:hypothetical protein